MGLGCALLSVTVKGDIAAARVEKFQATMGTGGVFERGHVRRRVRGNRIQTCRSELDSDQTKDKVKGDQNGDDVWVSARGVAGGLIEREGGL